MTDACLKEIAELAVRRETFTTFEQLHEYAKQMEGAQLFLLALRDSDKAEIKLLTEEVEQGREFVNTLVRIVRIGGSMKPSLRYADAASEWASKERAE